MRKKVIQSDKISQKDMSLIRIVVSRVIAFNKGLSRSLDEFKDKEYKQKLISLLNRLRRN